MRTRARAQGAPGVSLDFRAVRQGGVDPQVFARAGRACMRHAYGAHAMREAHTPSFPRCDARRTRLAAGSFCVYGMFHVKHSSENVRNQAHGPYAAWCWVRMGRMRCQRWARTDPCDASVGIVWTCATPVSGLHAPNVGHMSDSGFVAVHNKYHKVNFHYGRRYAPHPRLPSKRGESRRRDETTCRCAKFS